MSLQEHKLTDYAVSIAGLPDKIENKAQWLKQQFDARTDSEVRDRHNSLIDALDKDLAGRPTNESMAGAIDEKVVELGAGDMAQGVYDPGHRRQDVFAYADAVRRYAEGSSETLPPAETVTFTAGANRLESVAVSGFTTQTGTGDPAPDNVRPVKNAGTCNKKLVLTGAESWNWGASNGGHRGLLGLSGSPVDAAAGIWCTDAKAGYTTAPDTVQVSGKTLFLRLSRFDAEESADAFKAYLAQRYAAGDPVTVAYQDTTAAGAYYTGVAVQQNGAYRCEIIRLADRLHAGDTLETNVQSEYDAELIVDGAKVVSVSQTSSGNYRINLNVPDDFPVPEVGAVPNAKANYLFPTAANTLQSFDVKGVFCAYLSAIYIVLEDQTVTAKEAAQSYFNDNPLRIFYKSASGGAGRLVRRETHTRKTLVLDGTSVKFTKAGSYWNLANKTAPNVAAIPQCTCSALPGRVFQANTTYHFLFASETQIIPYFDTVDACNAFLAQQYAAGTPVTVEYDLAAPEVYVDEPVQPQTPAGTCTLSGESGTRLTATVSPPVGCVNGKSGASVTLTKADIGLSNVDNTPDAQKNVKGLAVEQTDVITGLSTGLYYYKANTPGAPSTVDGLLLALVYQPFGVQLAFPTNSGIFFRWAVNNWSEWVRLDQ